MKYLKYILIVIVVLLLAFFGRGLMTPSISYDSEVTVNKSVEESWAVMSDQSRVTEWLKEIKRFEAVSGTPNTVGAVTNIYVENEGQEMVMQETITAIEEFEKIAMTFTMDFMDMNYEMVLEEIEDGTKIKSNSVVKGNGFFAKAMVAWMGGPMKEQEDHNLNNLKSVIENNTIDYFPLVPENIPEID